MLKSAKMYGWHRAFSDPSSQSWGHPNIPNLSGQFPNNNAPWAITVTQNNDFARRYFLLFFGFKLIFLDITYYLWFISNYRYGTCKGCTSSCRFQVAMTLLLLGKSIRPDTTTATEQQSRSRLDFLISRGCQSF